MVVLGVCKPEIESKICQNVVGVMGYMQRKERQELYNLYFLQRVVINIKSLPQISYINCLPSCKMYVKGKYDNT